MARRALQGLPEGEVEALPAELRMMTVRERYHTVVDEPGGAAPHDDIAVVEGNP